MRTGLVITALIALTLGVVLAIGMWTPVTWEAEAAGVVHAPEPSIRELLARPAAWSAWTPWPEEGQAFEGPESGEGAMRSWDDPRYGRGSFTIREAREGLVRYTVSVEGRDVGIEGMIVLTAAADSTHVRWTEKGVFGRNLFLRLAGRSIRETQSAALAESLARLGAAATGDALAGGGTPG